MDIAVIGSNMVDLITYTNQMPKEGETLEAPAFKIGCGGKGANQAVAAAKLNSKVLMLTKVGDDIFADNTIRNLESWGINTTYVEKVPCTSSGVAPIFVNANSSNSILIIKGANKFLSPEDIDRAAEDLKKCKLIVLQLEVQLALPCCRSRYIVHNVWVFNAYWVTTGRIFEYHWRCQPV